MTIATGCPCTLIEPCAEGCSCVTMFSSVGCERCAWYGSADQRRASAIRIAAAITEAGPEVTGEGNAGVSAYLSADGRPLCAYLLADAEACLLVEGAAIHHDSEGHAFRAPPTIDHPPDRQPLVEQHCMEPGCDRRDATRTWEHDDYNQDGWFCSDHHEAAPAPSTLPDELNAARSVVLGWVRAQTNSTDASYTDAERAIDRLIAKAQASSEVALVAALRRAGLTTGAYRGIAVTATQNDFTIEDDKLIHRALALEGREDGS